MTTLTELERRVCALETATGLADVGPLRGCVLQLPVIDAWLGVMGWTQLSKGSLAYYENKSFPDHVIVMPIDCNQLEVEASIYTLAKIQGGEPADLVRSLVSAHAAEATKSTEETDE